MSILRRAGTLRLTAMIAIAIIVGLVAYFGIVNRSAAPTPAPEQGSGAVFVGDHEMGFEGYFERIRYAFRYDPEIVTVATSTGAGEAHHAALREGGRTHTIDFFYNGGAGFASAAEMWEAVPRCADCTPAAVPFPVARVTDAIAFENATELWMVLAHDPGFVIVKMEKPVAEVVRVLKTLWLFREESRKPGMTAVTAYLANAYLSDGMDCAEVFPVTRIVPQTAQVAKAALAELLKGPTAYEADHGYVTAIPVGTTLTSVTIAGGTARADFSSAVSSGGGSCSMLSRETQIRRTLLQFSTVKDVVISAEGKTEHIFEP